MLNRLSLNKLSLNRIDLNRIGGRDVGGSARPYIDPDLLKHVKMAISTWGKTNDDPDRTVLKDLSGNGNDMRLLNFGFAGNSGYGMYGADFTTWSKSDKVTSVDYKSFNFDTSVDWVLLYHKSNIGKDTPSFKVHINAEGNVYYNYINQKGILKVVLIKSENFETPVSYNTLYVGETPANIGFSASPGQGSITQLPDFEGWLCTDGVDDLIESVKPVSEMLEGSNEITVVSIIHQISSMSNVAGARNNNIRASYNEICLRNIVGADGVGKTGIYGYTCANIRAIPTVPVTVNNILGDKNDYSSSGAKFFDIDLFSVQGFRDRDSGALYELSQVAYAGGFIANKSLTTDEINQIIAYFDLDRPGQIIKPQLYCNIKKQGITNDNHAEFNDQLIDFVGGRNIQLNNVAWEGESGINSYPVVFGANKTWAVLRYESDVVKYNLAPNKITIYKSNRNAALLYSYVYNAGITNKVTIPSFKMKVTGLKEGQAVDYRYISESERAKGSILSLTKDGIYDIPKSYPIEPNENTSDGTWVGILINSTDDNYNLTLEVLPTIDNALCLDGISDFGKATGLPILKDYTVVADREFLGSKSGSIVSKSHIVSNGAFIFETFTDKSTTTSFGSNTLVDISDFKKISYQSKYIYNGNPIQVGAGVDGDSMCLGVIRENDSRFSKFALWSLMLFPYSLSEFLLERQLKKYKAGTLYPDMIEFRPVIKSNVPYSSISYSVNPGEYIIEGSTVTITVTLSNASDKLVGVSSSAIADISISGDNGVYEVTGKVTKSPQKINIVISSYLTMLGNDTLISNETLIKNE